MRYIFNFFWRHSLDICTLIQNNYEFLVCLSVCQIVTSLLKLDKYGDISFFGWNIFLIFFWDFPGTLVQKFSLCLAELTYWLLSFCVLVLTLKPLMFLLSEGQLLRPSGLVTDVLFLCVLLTDWDLVLFMQITVLLYSVMHVHFPVCLFD